MKKILKPGFLRKAVASLILSLLIITGSSCSEYLEPILSEYIESSQTTASITTERTTKTTQPEEDTDSSPPPEEISEATYNTESELPASEPEQLPDSSEKEDISYRFRTKKLYDDHFKKHGKEFGDITKDEYLQLANDLILSQSESILHKYSDDGDRLFYDPDNNYFLVLSEDGYIRTLFRPDKGIEYWNRQ